jgi:HlyD family secretion protein
MMKSWHCLLLCALGLSACNDSGDQRWLGYVEGRYVYVSTTGGGRIEALPIREGDEVQQGQLLAQLEAGRERAQLAAAEAAAGAAQATAADRSKGQRPEEIAQLEARLRQAEADFGYADRETQRLAALYERSLIPKAQLDEQRSARDRAQAQVSEARAAISTGRLAARSDTQKAAQAQYEQALAETAQAQWSLDQRQLLAPDSGRIDRIYHHVGEYVGAGEPVLAVLPPRNRVLRFWVPEAQQSLVHPGSSVRIHCAACGDQDATAVVRWISASAEYTPPVLYTRSRRARLSFMVEAEPQGKAAQLNPGLPIEVELQP